MSTLLSVALACATFVAAAGESPKTHELSLLQTVVQVDESAIQGPVTIYDPRFGDWGFQDNVARGGGNNRVAVWFILAAVIHLAFSVFSYYRTITTMTAVNIAMHKEAQAMKAKAKGLSIPGATFQSGEGPGESPGESDLNEATAPVVDATGPTFQGLTWATWLLGIVFNAMEVFCTAQYVPHMPAMRQDFGCSIQDMAWTLQVNWILKGATNFVSGVVSDRVGRKPIITLATFLLAMACCGAASANSLSVFWWARVMQGLGEGVQNVIGSTYRDAYDGPEGMQARARVGSLSMVVGLVAPAFAPSFGAEVTEMTGSWRSCFWLFGFINVVIWILMLAFFKETADIHNRPNTSIRHDMKLIFTDRTLVTLLLTGLVGAAGGSVQGSISVFVAEEQFGCAPTRFSRLAFIGCGVTIAGMMLSYMVSWFGLHTFRLMRIGQTLQTLYAIAGIVLIRLHLMDHLWCVLLLNWLGQLTGVPVGMTMGPIFTDRMKHSSGLAGGVQGAICGILGTFFAKLLTPVVAPHGSHGLMYCGQITGLIACVIFWIGIGFSPPDWLNPDKKRL